jgi:hypothetical protein
MLQYNLIPSEPFITQICSKQIWFVPALSCLNALDNIVVVDERSSRELHVLFMVCWAVLSVNRLHHAGEHTYICG